MKFEGTHFNLCDSKCPKDGQVERHRERETDKRKREERENAMVCQYRVEKGALNDVADIMIFAQFW